MRKMESETFYKIIDELSELGWKGNIQPHCYGEPLLDDRMLIFIKYIKDKLPTSTISFFTNGDFLTLDLYKELIKKGVDGFRITQHSYEVPDNMREILDYRKEHGDCGISMFYGKLENISSRGGSIEVEGAIKPKKCPWVSLYPTLPLGIDYAGNVMFCCEDYFGTVKIGNVINERLIRIWNKSYYKKLRKEVIRGVYRLGICKGCKGGTIPHQNITQPKIISS